MLLLVTCPFGTNGILNQELKRLGYKPINCFDTGSFVETDIDGMMHINLCSRIASKVYMQIVADANCQNFDQLFDEINKGNWNKRLTPSTPLNIKVVTKYSALTALTTIQSISHKAILKNLGQENYNNNETKNETIDILVYLDHDILNAYINTSGAGLHERGYRQETGEAPLKENLAAALVIHSGRTRRQSLWDPCCGSGTICIEAAMIAKNIAPGLNRNFAFQQFMHYNQDKFQSIKNTLSTPGFTDKKYSIIGSDIDPVVLTKAKYNAERAGVANCIQFISHDLQKPLKDGIIGNKTPTYIVANPPYGKRMNPEDIDDLYKKIISIAAGENKQASIISSYPDFYRHIPRSRTCKETKNGADDCAIWKKK